MEWAVLVLSNIIHMQIVIPKLDMDIKKFDIANADNAPRLKTKGVKLCGERTQRLEGYIWPFVSELDLSIGI